MVTPAWVREAAATWEPLAVPVVHPARIRHQPRLEGCRGTRPCCPVRRPTARPRPERIFAGLAFALSGDDGFHAQFGALLTHAGADVVDGTDLDGGGASDDDDDACDLVVVQESPAERRGFRGSALRRAAEGTGCRACGTLGQWSRC